MKKLFGILTLVCGFAAGFAHADEVIEWDFSKGISPVGSKMEFVTSQTAEIKDGALVINGGMIKSNSSAIKSKQIYPDLNPKGAFRISFVFTLDQISSKEPYLMLWDNKGVYYDKKSGKALDNSGMTFALYPRNRGTYFIPRFWFGLGTKTVSADGKAVTVVKGKKMTLEFEYDGVSKYSFFADGKPCGSGTLKNGGPIAPAVFNLAIGNRTIGNFLPFDGKIHSVKLVKKGAAK